MQLSGCGQAARIPVKDSFLKLVVKSSEEAAINRDSPKENMNTSNHVSANLASAWDLITVLSKSNESGCHELSPGTQWLWKMIIRTCCPLGKHF